MPFQDCSKLPMPLAVEVIDLLNEVRYDIVIFALNKSLDIYKGSSPINASPTELPCVSSLTSDSKISKEIMQHLDFKILGSGALDDKIVSFKAPETRFKGASDEDIDIVEDFLGYPPGLW